MNHWDTFSTHFRLGYHVPFICVSQLADIVVNKAIKEQKDFQGYSISSICEIIEAGLNRMLTDKMGNNVACCKYETNYENWCPSTKLPESFMIGVNGGKLWDVVCTERHFFHIYFAAEKIHTKDGSGYMSKEDVFEDYFPWWGGHVPLLVPNPTLPYQKLHGVLKKRLYEWEESETPSILFHIVENFDNYERFKTYHRRT